MTGDVEELSERSEWPLGDQDDEEQHRQTGQQGPETVPAGDARGELSVRLPHHRRHASKAIG